MAKKLITGIFTTLALLLGGTAWGAAPFVVDAANGTVTDTSTGLMWEQCAAGLIGNDCTGTVLRYTWVNALGLAATQ
ncbi:MAG: hypothetical protein IPN53_14320, partial [Comamonadaceae bacterium]|nr:hypothetical protein [Comamonadaceae bacterium]